MKGSAGKAGRRILIIVENLPVPFDRRVWQEATTLHEAGYEVSIICPKMKGYTRPKEVVDGIAIYRHPLPIEGNGVGGYLAEYGAALFWQSLLAWRILFTRGFDAIHACNPPDTIFFVAAPFKLLGRRFLFDHHDVCPELYEAKFGTRRSFLYRIMRGLERWTFRFADISIATNNSYRDIAVQRGGMPQERVFVVRSGPNLERLQPVAPNGKWKHGRRFLVGYVGVMGRQEGIDLLLEAVRYVVYERGRTDIQFVLVGGGTECGAMEDYAREIGVHPYVTFTGRIPDDELIEALSTADVCVNPDRVNAMNDLSTMNKIMEYMALGKPMVQFDLKEGRHSAAEASLYAAPNDPRDLADKLVQLLDSPEQRMRMGEFGRKRVIEKLSWEHEAPNLLRAYDALFHGDSAKAHATAQD